MERKTDTLNRHFGWIPDLPDHRDYRFKLLDGLVLPKSVDLRGQCPPVEDQGQLGSCHDDKTEVLTEHGFKLFAELNGSERLATVNPETAELLFEIPTRIVRFPYKGEMHCAASQSLNFKVTPDHKMLVRKWNESKRTLNTNYQLIAAKDIGWYSGLMNRVQWKGSIQSDTFTLPGVAHERSKEQRLPKDIPLKYWVRFLGIYLAEGTLLKRDQHKGRISCKIQIAATKDREKDFVRETLAEIGVSALELKDRFTFNDRRIYEAMASIGLEGVKAGNKFVPAFIYHLNAEMISEFLAGHFAGDGSEQRGLRSHYTSSSKLASDLQALIFMSGNETRMTVREGRSSMTADGRTIVGTLPEHRVSVCETKNLSIERSEVWFTENYDGEVFCAEVPTYHTLVTRREGKILISGNCTSFATGAAIRLARKRQNLPDFITSHLFLYYNSRAKNQKAVDAGATIRGAIKAAAAQGDCPEPEWPYDIEKFASKPPTKAYTDALTDRAITYQRVSQSLTAMKNCLAQGLPIVIGISVYESFESDTVASTGVVPMPSQDEQLLGGHALLVVGYDTTNQWFIVRNSWGASFGDKGYIYIPFAYLENSDLASDFWTIQTIGK